jgi:hypothetical protein
LRIRRDGPSRILVEPDRYVLYACPELATAWQANMNRQRELLMIKAGTGTGGQIASSMAYRPEYNQLRGEMVQLRKAAADKNCRAMPSARAPDAVSAPTRAAPSQQIAR